MTSLDSPPVLDAFVALLERCIETQASDLHLSGDMAPYARIHGQIEQIDDDTLDAALMEELAASLLNERQKLLFAKQMTIDLAYVLPVGVTFRINMFRERGRVALVARRLDDQFHSLDQLHLPPEIADFADLAHGLVLVTGPTGSGKSTTLATLIHQINSTRACHIITIEDPMEYVHRNLRSVVHQRELVSDVPSFAEAVRASLREDPDVILIGEMRDLATMRAAIVAAETGHLVFSTLHCGDAVGAIDRMIGVFPAEEQESIRHQLSGVLRGVVAQKLVRGKDGGRRVPCVEILKCNTAVANLIRRGETHGVHLVMETGGDDGMYLFDECLAEHVACGRVEVDVARPLVRDAQVFEARLRIARGRAEARRSAAPSDGANAAAAPGRTGKSGFWSFGR